MSTDCPRCGSTLTTFALSDAESVSCDACGYVGVEADHTGEPTRVESWEDALRRFQKQIAGEQASGEGEAEEQASEESEEEEDEEQASEEDEEEEQASEEDEEEEQASEEGEAEEQASEESEDEEK